MTSRWRPSLWKRTLTLITRVLPAAIGPILVLILTPRVEATRRPFVRVALPTLRTATLNRISLPRLALRGPTTLTLPIRACSLTQFGSLPVNPAGHGMG
jgi:hypothetical protein